MGTIAHISDLHFGRHSAAAADDLLASLRERDPDLVVLTGDLTQRARQGEFIQARHFLDRISQPKLVVPGNHDMPLYNLLQRFLTPFAKYHRYISSLGLSGDLFSNEEIAVLGLNTARAFTHKSGRISTEQIAQVRRTFSEVPRGVFKVLATHHPLGYPSDERPLQLAGRSALALDAVAAAGVHLLMSGHHHRALSGDMKFGMGAAGSVLILHAGTAISTRLRGTEGNTYNLIRVDGGELSTSMKLSISIMARPAEGGFRASRVLSYHLQEGRWRPA
jgi:3',5'-cyclic AMP phosphodiesterase CpdA